MPNQPRADNPARAIRVPDDLWAAVKRKAAERGETVSGIVRAALERYEAGADWQPTRWWRSVGPDGELWGESSNEQEIRRMARPTDRIEQLWETVARTEWRAP